MRIKITLKNGKELLGYRQRQDIESIISDIMYTGEVFVFNNICESNKPSEDFNFAVRGSDIECVCIYE